LGVTNEQFTVVWYEKKRKPKYVEEQSTCYQAQSPGFKPQYCQTNKKDKKVANFTTYYSNKEIYARCWWLSSVIPATQEAEIRRIVVRSQPRQTVHETLSQKTHHKKKKME
jgi:hypothetical protein